MQTVKGKSGVENGKAPDLAAASVPDALTALRVNSDNRYRSKSPLRSHMFRKQAWLETEQQRWHGRILHTCSEILLEWKCHKARLELYRSCAGKRGCSLDTAA
jgi:hypothetical protein